MIRVVVDTNVLVSALLQPQGLPARVLQLLIAEPAAQLCISAEIFAEYEEVIRRPRFKRSENEISDTLRAIRRISIWVKPSQRIRACVDPDDDMFLECAQAAGAHYLVTGNSSHFPEKWAGILIVSPRQFVEAVPEIGEEPANF